VHSKLYPVNLAPKKSLRPGGARAPNLPPGYAYARNKFAVTTLRLPVRLIRILTVAALAVSWVGARLTGGNTDAPESPPSLAARSLARHEIDPRAPIYTTNHRSSSAQSVSRCVCLTARVRPSVRRSVRARSCGRSVAAAKSGAESVALFRQQTAIIIRRHPRQPTDL